jgi:hypothetical protein
MVRRALRRFVLAGTVGLMAIGGVATGYAGADPTPPPEIEEPEEVEQPRPLLGAAASCHEDGSADVKVIVYEDRDEPFDVRLASLTGTFTANRDTELDTEHFVHVTVFGDVPVGEYAVAVVGDGSEGPADGVRVVVKPCDEPGSGEDLLTIEVECQAGWGIVTFQVINPTTGETTSYTLTIDGIPAYEIELDNGLFLRVTENGYDDGTHTAKLSGDGIVEVEEDFTVACASGNAPRLQVTVACVDNRGKVDVEVRNPNRTPVDYTVAIKDLTEPVRVSGGERGTVTVADLPDGDHPVRVTGSDQTEAVSVAAIDCDQTTMTTTTTATTTRTPETTTTTTPAPQGRPGGDLARTGSAVGQMIGVGALAMLLGGALLVIGRRRRARGH